MGLLSEGSPLEWDETKKWAAHVREHGITQFINLYHRLKNRTGDVLKWGDEVEYMLVHFDDEAQRVRLSLKADPVLKALQEAEEQNPDDHPTTWRPEYAAYMVEGTPGKPFGNLMSHFNQVESNMRRRRQEVQSRLDANEAPMTLTCFPLLGVPGFTFPEFSPSPGDPKSAPQSLFFPDEAIFQGHPRFRTLTRNIRNRRGKKVAINIPIFKDEATPSPFVEDFSAAIGESEGEGAASALPDHIYMDAMGFGMGCSCLQMTFQACNIREARHLYDQLAPITPIILALSAAAPVYRGFLSDVDCRWDVISASVDDRTDEEKGMGESSTGTRLISKSRYDSIDSYLSPCSVSCSDIPLEMDEALRDRMMVNGVDETLARHIAHLFIRDPVSLFSEKIHQNDEEDSDHFENIQSTNWQTMRFKPPPPNSPIGWRVEFRPCEVQLTDFENAAYAVFIVLLTRVILSLNLDFVMPISKVDENFRRAQKRGAVLNQKFYFRKDTQTHATPSNLYESVERAPCDGKSAPPKNEVELEEMTIDEIINGQRGGGFQGLIPMMRWYLQSTGEVDVDTSCTIYQYLRLISMRASGELMTLATWIRTQVRSHPDYKKDSRVTNRMGYDLLKKMHKISVGELQCAELLPSYETKSKEDIPAAIEKAQNLQPEKKI